MPSHTVWLTHNFNTYLTATKDTLCALRYLSSCHLTHITNPLSSSTITPWLYPQLQWESNLHGPGWDFLPQISSWAPQDTGLGFTETLFRCERMHLFFSPTDILGTNLCHGQWSLLEVILKSKEVHLERTLPNN